MSSVAVATCNALPDGDEDAASLRAALAARGIDSSWRIWNSSSVDWAGFDLVVIRSTWDYTADRASFLAWAAARSNLHNPAPVLAWNTDKTYLRDLADAGLPVVPTRWASPGTDIDALDTEFVVKPSIGAGSKGVGRFDPSRPGALAAAAEHVRALHSAGRTVLVQPYVSDVDVSGETALIYLDGRFSHSIVKGAMLAPSAVNDLDAALSRSLFLSERVSVREPGPAELAVGAQVVDYVRDRFGGDLLYTRVDLLPAPEGPVVVELELAEPSLFLSFVPSAADTFAAAISRRINHGSPA